MTNKLSKESMQILLKMQQNETNEYLIYKNIASGVKKEEDRKILINIANEENNHATIWQGYTGKKLKANIFTVLKYKIMSKIFGYTFAIKIMEGGEIVAQKTYSKLSEEIPEAKRIIEDEDRHEKALISILDEDRLKYIGSMVLGLNDALVEFTGMLAGLSFALADNRLVALSGIITGISATLSMGSSEYLSSKADGDKNAFQAACYTSMMYIFAVALMISPYLIFEKHLYVHAVITMLIIVVLIIFFFTYYISVARDLNFKKRFFEMFTVSLSVALVSFLVGIVVKKFLGLDI